MQCPYCARFEGVNGPYIQKLITEKKATIVFHMLSFAGPESVLAANAVACSADEGKFLQYHAYLYANQSPTENSGKWSIEGLLSAGSEVGLTSSTFKSCVADGTYGQWVKNVADDGASKNINATPTVLKDGQKLDGNVVFFDPVAFAKAIEG
jgi:protein-disulfide isomerase